MFFAQKTPNFGPKNRLRIWGVPPTPPLRIFFLSEKGVTDFGGTPPPLTDKIRKVVFYGLPNGLTSLALIVSGNLQFSHQLCSIQCGMICFMQNCAMQWNAQNVKFCKVQNYEAL